MCFKPYRKLLKIYVLLLPIFQRTFGFFAVLNNLLIFSILIGAAKVRAFFISAKNIWNFYFQNFCVYLVFKNWFFCRIAKIQRWNFLSNGIRDFFGISLSLSIVSVLFLKAGAKIWVISFTPNISEIFSCFCFVKELVSFDEIVLKLFRVTNKNF